MDPQQFISELGGWQNLIAEDHTIEQNGAQVPTRTVQAIKEIPDVATLAKSYIDSQSEIGRRVRIPAKDAKTEDIAAFRSKVYEAGLFPAPLADAKEYGITKPEIIPEGIGWNDDLATKFANTLHKHGASKALANDLLEVYGEALVGTQKTLKTSYDDGMAALRGEYGAKFDEVMTQTRRVTGHINKESGEFVPGIIFKTEEELAFFDELGLGNHPGFLSVLMRIAPLTQQDSSFIADPAREAAAQGEQVRQELAKIMNDTAHPMHQAWKRGDKAANDYIDELYRKAYGAGQVALGAGITVEGQK